MRNSKKLFLFDAVGLTTSGIIIAIFMLIAGASNYFEVAVLNTVSMNLLSAIFEPKQNFESVIASVGIILAIGFGGTFISHKFSVDRKRRIMAWFYSSKKYFRVVRINSLNPASSPTLFKKVNELVQRMRLANMPEIGIYENNRDIGGIFTKTITSLSNQPPMLVVSKDLFKTVSDETQMKSPKTAREINGALASAVRELVDYNDNWTSIAFKQGFTSSAIILAIYACICFFEDFA